MIASLPHAPLRGDVLKSIAVGSQGGSGTDEIDRSSEADGDGDWD
jgi:hypothetical protein